MNHLPVLAVLLPLLVAATLLLVERRGIALQRAISLSGAVALVVLAVALLLRADRGEVLVYLLGDWPARLGIALVVDRLGALMVLATALLAVPCLLHACAGWDRRAPHFHVLFHVQLMGLNGAFLTGDLFNLFVFFEVLLIASYGLLLSGGRGARIRAGLHYVVFNVTASTLFLVALGLLYGLTGTLNMAEMAVRVAAAGPGDALLLRVASGILLVVFCAKAALLPLYLWLPGTYARAPATVAAFFAVMTKLGVYAVLRVYTLVFGVDAGALAGWAWPWLLVAGSGTLVLATLGAVSAPTLRALTAYLVVASAATLFIAVALATADAVGAGLYYLVHSTYAAATLFLVADMVRRTHAHARRAGIAVQPMDLTRPALLYLLAAVSICGLPPLSGFIGKLLLLQAVPTARIGLVWTVVLATSLLTLIALARAGSRVFWEGQFAATPAETLSNDAPDAPRPATLPAHDGPRFAATLILIGYGIALAIAAAPVQRYTRDAAAQVLAPAATIQAVRGATPLIREPAP